MLRVRDVMKQNPARRLLVVDNQKFRGERREKKIPTSETNTVRVFGFCHLGGPAANSEGRRRL